MGERTMNTNTSMMTSHQLCQSLKRRASFLSEDAPEIKTLRRSRSSLSSLANSSPSPSTHSDETGSSSAAALCHPVEDAPALPTLLRRASSNLSIDMPALLRRVSSGLSLLDLDTAELDELLAPTCTAPEEDIEEFLQAGPSLMQFPPQLPALALPPDSATWHDDDNGSSLSSAPLGPFGPYNPAPSWMHPSHTTEQQLTEQNPVLESGPDKFEGQQVVMVTGKYKGKNAFVERKVKKKYRVQVDGVPYGLEFYSRSFDLLHEQRS